MFTSLFDQIWVKFPLILDKSQIILSGTLTTPRTGSGDCMGMSDHLISGCNCFLLLEVLDDILLEVLKGILLEVFIYIE